MANSKTDATDVQWTTVSEAPEELTKVTFNTIGDQFIGQYLGESLQNDESRGGSYTQYRFTDDSGTRYFINGRYTLRDAMKKIPPGSLVRITLTAFREVGRESQMQIFQVDGARLAPDTSIPGPVVSDASMLAVQAFAETSEPPPF